MVGENILVEIEPESSRFSKGNEKWLREREDLRSELERELGPGSLRRGSLAAGDKGLPLEDSIIVALGSAHAFQALARCVGSWLRYRRGDSSVKMTATVNGKEIHVELDVTNASADAVQPFIKALGDTIK